MPPSPTGAPPSSAPRATRSTRSALCSTSYARSRIRAGGKSLKLALAAIVVALSGAAPHATVLGWDYDSRRISWFDARSLTSATGAATGWNRPLCSWSFSPDGHRVALSDCHGTVRFGAVPSLKSLGRIGGSSGLWDAAAL